MINQFIYALNNIHANLHPEEVLDALWLADKLYFKSISHDQTKRQMQKNVKLKDGKVFEGTSQKSQHNKIHEEVESNDDSKKSSDNKSQKYIYPMNEQCDMSNVNTFRAPSSHFIPDKLSIIRALRPLKRYIQSKNELVFDEAATVEKIAEEKLWLPALKGIPKQQFSLYLIIDYSPSMVIWQPFISELKQLFEHMGLFHYVKSWWMINDQNANDVQFLSSLGEGSIPRHSIEINCSELKNIIFILTDCISLAWKNGSIAKTIYEWGKNNHVTIMQMLPNRIWAGTALNDTVDLYLHATEQGQKNNQLICDDKTLELDQYSEIFVPIITLDAKSFHIWSRFITVTENTWIPAILLNKNDFDNSILSDVEKVEQEISANERVKLFFATTSPKAQKLAVLLSAAPLTLPVIHLIQKIMLPDSNQTHFAEFFLGGLIKRVSESWQVDPNIILYDFHDGVRGILQNSILAPKALKVQNIVSNYIEKRCGENIDFLAFIGNDDTGEILKGEKLLPFARIKTDMLNRFGDQKKIVKKELIYKIRKSNFLSEEHIAAITTILQPDDFFTLYEYLKKIKDTDITKASTLYDKIFTSFDLLNSLKSPKKYSSDLTYKYYLKKIISDIFYIDFFECYYPVSEKEVQSFEFDIQLHCFKDNASEIFVDKCFFKIIEIIPLQRESYKMVLELYPNKDRTENWPICFFGVEHEWQKLFYSKNINIGSILCFEKIKFYCFLNYYDTTLKKNPELIDMFQLNEYKKSFYLSIEYCLRNLKEKISEDYFSIALGNAHLENIIVCNNSSLKISTKSNIQQLKAENPKKIEIDQIDNIQVKILDVSSLAEDYPFTYDMVTLEVSIKNQVLTDYIIDYCGDSKKTYINIFLRIEQYLNSNTFEVVDNKNIAKKIGYEDLLLYKEYNQISSLITFICKIRKKAYEMYEKINVTDNFQKLYLQQLFFCNLKNLSDTLTERQKCWAVVSAIVAATEISQ